MFTPYDWQEGIGNRAQYIEGKLAQGAPVIAVSLDEGILVFTYRRQARKIYEVYDRLIFAGIGQQSDVEALRMAAVDFASQEGYNRSEQDVTIQRVATALSAPLKKAFSDFSASPLVARSLFGEVGATPEDDLYYTLDYDGDYAMSRRVAVVAGTPEVSGRLIERLEGLKAKTAPDKAIDSLKEIWAGSFDDESGEDPTEGLRPEAVLLERSDAHEDRFRTLIREDF
jgi:proteasome alpha subunit